MKRANHRAEVWRRRAHLKVRELRTGGKTSAHRRMVRLGRRREALWHRGPWQRHLNLSDGMIDRLVRDIAALETCKSRPSRRRRAWWRGERPRARDGSDARGPILLEPSNFTNERTGHVDRQLTAVYTLVL